MESKVNEISSKLQELHTEYASLINDNKKATLAGLAGVGIRLEGSDISYISRDWGKFVDKIFLKGVCSQKTVSEVKIESGSYHSGYAAAKKRFGIKRIGHEACNYYKPNEYWDKLKPAHADLVKDPAKRKALLELLTFRDKVKSILGGTNETKTVMVNTTYMKYDKATINLNPNTSDTKPAREDYIIFAGEVLGILSKIELRQRANPISITVSCRRDELKFGYSYGDYAQFGTINVGVSTITEKLDNVTGLDAIFKNEEVKKFIDDTSQSLKIVSKVWDHLQEKYSCFLFMNGCF